VSEIEDGPVPTNEIEAGADALKALWESEENQRAIRETGYGYSYLFQARAVLEAALKVRGKSVTRHDTKQ
jgi:hypothetical protein